ncbi:MAG: multicopper oxidase domain-containing protein [Rhodanobacter sp.]
MDRRDFLKTASLSALAASIPLGADAFNAGLSTPASAVSASTGAAAAADYSLHIATGVLELGPRRFVSTTLYNGDFPGPLLRFKQGQRAVVDIFNDTDIPEQVHWHGQYLPDSVDGAFEERTPPIPAHGHRREVFTPGPTGLRYYHTHVRAGADLTRGLYSGQAGPVYIEPTQNPGAYDREVFLTLKEFQPYLNHVDDDSPFMAPGGMDVALVGVAANADPAAGSVPPGYELAYESFAIKGKMLRHGEPVKVRHGERVLLHVVNASATENRSLALPGHTFKVVALDGNRCRIRRSYLSCGSAPPSASPPSWRCSVRASGSSVIRPTPIATRAWASWSSTRAPAASRNGTRRPPVSNGITGCLLTRSARRLRRNRSSIS